MTIHGRTEGISRSVLLAHSAQRRTEQAAQPVALDICEKGREEATILRFRDRAKGLCFGERLSAAQCPDGCVNGNQPYRERERVATFHMGPPRVFEGSLQVR